MILELDCGNSLVKWRVLDASAAVVARGSAESAGELVASVHTAEVTPDACRMVSVRNELETEEFRATISAAWSIEVCVAQSAPELAGVINGYDEYQRLGMDRWLAVVGAAGLSSEACLVLDLGTAVTADYVSAQGRHLGGFICPGVRMMCGELRMHTRRIQFAGDHSDLEFRRPGSNTGDAVRRGSLLMLRAFVECQLRLAPEWLGQDFDIFVTGGDAGLVFDLIPRARFLPDLVFIGLAKACPLLES